MSALRKWSLNYEPKRINESYQLTSEEKDIPGLGSHFVQLTRSNTKDTWKHGGAWNGGCAQFIQSSKAKTKRVSSPLQASNENTESAKLSGMEAESHILVSCSGFHPAKTHALCEQRRQGDSWSRWGREQWYLVRAADDTRGCTGSRDLPSRRKQQGDIQWKMGIQNAQLYFLFLYPGGC